MAYTSLDIANSALIKLGARRIETFEDGTEEANTAKDRYKKVIKLVLCRYKFSCALHTKKLSADATFSSDLTTTTDLYPYRFKVPSDWLQTVAVFNAQKVVTHDYQFEGKYILTPLSVIYIRYVRDIVDQGLLTDEVGEAISAYLALDMSQKLTSSSVNRQQLEQIWKDAIADAKAADAQRKAPLNYVDRADEDDNYTFLSARRS